MKVNELVAGLFGLYPKELAAEYDNVGLLVGDGENEITGVVVALDCTFGAIELAKSVGANVIVSHHPVIFSGLKSVTDGDMVFELIKSGIAAVAMHTNFDSAKDGVCDILSQKIGLGKVVPLLTKEGFIIRQGELGTCLSCDEFAGLLKEKLGGSVKYCDAGQIICKVAVCSGSGSDFLADAISSGADAFVTAEVKHHLYLEALDCGISLFDCGHFETEIIAVENLKNAVGELLGDKVYQYQGNEIKVI